VPPIPLMSVHWGHYGSQVVDNRFIHFTDRISECDLDVTLCVDILSCLLVAYLKMLSVHQILLH
jgi:hypothetical protein